MIHRFIQRKNSATTPSPSHRIHNLDYLRGLMAFSILLFHYQKWTTDHWNPNTLLGKLGVYGVSIFFVLSGLTLGLVYGNGQLLPTKASVFAYAQKRILRIFPLLLLATTATLLLDAQGTWSWKLIFLNITGLFGFFQPDGDIALGAWSIGNELVFYCFFPILIWLEKGKLQWILGLFWVISLAIGVYFAFERLNMDLSVHAQWKDYVSPGNNTFFFVSGVAMAVFGREIKNQRLANMIAFVLLLSVLVFYCYPIAGETGALIAGYNRLFLSALSILICATVWKLKLNVPRLLHQILHWLGEISYTIYLMHPLVYRVLKGMNARFFQLDLFWVAFFALPITLMVSHFIYHYFEKKLPLYLQ
jgi:exopolysaccharide production protein ExoZ